MDRAHPRPSSDPQPTEPLRPVVVGVDGSPDAALALDWAARQAARQHLPLTVVHATGLTPVTGVVPTGGTGAAGVTHATDHGRTLLDAAAAHVALDWPDLEVHRVLSRTDPREALLGLADDASMVVIGSRGRGPVASLLLGSVGLAVSRLAGCPVVVVRPEAPGVRNGVLVGVSDAEVALPAVEVAFRLASAGGWALTVLQCTWEATTPPGTDTDRRRTLARAVEPVAARHRDVAYALQLRRGFLDEHLVTMSSDMDVVVVGSRVTSPLAELVHGSLAPAVVEHCRGTVAVVPLPTRATARAATTAATAATTAGAGTGREPVRLR